MVHFENYKNQLVILSNKGDDKKQGSCFPIDDPISSAHKSLWVPFDFPPLKEWSQELPVIFQSSLVVRCLSLRSCLYDDLHHDSYEMLGSRIIFGDFFWGPSFKITGEFYFIPKYWEWTEDVLFHFDKALTSVGIVDAVHASLFIYDCNKDVM